MGRHASTGPAGRGSGGRPLGLLGWGLFSAVLLGVCGPMLGLGAVAAVALAATMAVVFALLWLLAPGDAAP
ncbi:hypothetical protein ACQ3I4_04695 [Zafaria sp. Z1313]|uniref:hypothetical protein n=1 Tax=Zafaria sp. Z1313 TaxID=3423202 RepID=UPI003D302056